MTQSMQSGGLEQDRAGRPAHILFVSPSSPWPPDSGGAQRTALLLEALSNEGQVDLCLLGRLSPDQRHELGARYGIARLLELPNEGVRRILPAVLGRIDPELALALPNRRKAAQLARIIEARRYDLVVIRYSAAACQLKALGRLVRGTPRIVDVDDFMVQTLTDARGSGRSRLRSVLMPLARLALSRIERRVLLEADGLWINGWRPQWLSDRTEKIVELPNLSWHRAANEAPPAPDGSPIELLGIAQFSYAPNFEGFDWFIREVWPIVRAARPRARLRLVGSHPRAPDLQRWRAIPGAEVTGKVEDVAREYGSALVAIAPIFRGGGTKIKVLEALEMGLPCVCSTHAASALTGLESLLVTDDPHRFAQHCLELIDNPVRRAALSTSGQREVRKSYPRSLFRDRVSTLVRQNVGNAVRGVEGSKVLGTGTDSGEFRKLR